VCWTLTRNQLAVGYGEFKYAKGLHDSLKRLDSWEFSVFHVADGDVRYSANTSQASLGISQVIAPTLDDLSYRQKVHSFSMVALD
jgi:hypothetical protein